MYSSFRLLAIYVTESRGLPSGLNIVIRTSCPTQLVILCCPFLTFIFFLFHQMQAQYLFLVVHIVSHFYPITILE